MGGGACERDRITGTQEWATAEQRAHSSQEVRALATLEDKAVEAGHLKGQREPGGARAVESKTGGSSA